MNRVLNELRRSRERRAKQRAEWERHSIECGTARDSRQVLINRFRTACGAVPCPPDVYALWLRSWIKQGGRITHSYDYNLSGSWMMATRSTELAIPTAYGAQALDLVIPESVDIPQAATSGDRRQGWEYGHGTVLRLGRVPTTNNPSCVASYLDVEELL